MKSSPVSLQSGNNTIDPDIDVLLVIQPKQAFDDWTKFCIDQFVMRGGKVGWFVNKVKADVQTSQATPLNLGFDDMTRQYGFAIANNLVNDLNASMINVQQQQGQFVITNVVRYTCFPQISDVNKQNPMVKDLQGFPLFFPSSIDTVTPGGGARVNYIPLFQSSEFTKVQTGRYDINPMAQPRREEYAGGRKLLGLALTGALNSAWTGRPVPHPSDSTAMTPTVEIRTQSPEIEYAAGYL